MSAAGTRNKHREGGNRCLPNWAKCLFGPASNCGCPGDRPPGMIPPAHAADMMEAEWALLCSERDE